MLMRVKTPCRSYARRRGKSDYGNDGGDFSPCSTSFVTAVFSFVTAVFKRALIASSRALAAAAAALFAIATLLFPPFFALGLLEVGLLLVFLSFASVSVG